MISGLREIVSSYIASLSLNDIEKEVFWRSYTRIEGDETPVGSSVIIDSLSLSVCQQRLAHLNERTARRKKDGVYYTDEDLTEYMVYNAFNCYVDESASNVHDVGVIFQKFKTSPSTTIERVLKASTFDPTCGAGEFLLSAAKFKYKILQAIGRPYTDKDLAIILSSFRGNDIERDSIVITQIRLLLQYYEYLQDKRNVSLLENGLEAILM